MSFEQSIEFCLNIEGGYCDEPGDRGGETYRGIARNMWKSWPGWRIIDEVKSRLKLDLSKRSNWKVLTNELFRDELLNDLVYGFYRSNFWEAASCDYFSDPVAHLLLDFSINSGVSRGVKHLQNGLNMCEQKVSVTGKISQVDFDASSMVEPLVLAEMMLEDRRNFYNAIVEAKPDQIKFIKGWLNRVEANRQFIEKTFV